MVTSLATKRAPQRCGEEFATANKPSTQRLPQPRHLRQSFGDSSTREPMVGRAPSRPTLRLASATHEVDNPQDRIICKTVVLCLVNCFFIKLFTGFKLAIDPPV